jgi:arylsulfate sulfotransferase
MKLNSLASSGKGNLLLDSQAKGTTRSVASLRFPLAVTKSLNTMKRINARNGMLGNLFLRRLVKLAATMAIMKSAICADAITFRSPPVFTPATNAPLSGVLAVKTDIDSRVSVLVNDGTETWRHNFFDYSTNHSEVILGFKPGRTNQIQVILYDKFRNSATNQQPLTFVTVPLPTNFPHSTVLKSEPGKMEPGYTLFIIQYYFGHNTYVTVMNNSGEVVWYSPTPASGDDDVRQLANGDLFLEEPPPANDFIEINMLGQRVRTWRPPVGFPVNVHEGVKTDHGTILYISDASRVASNFPTSDTVPNAPLTNAIVDDTFAVEVSDAGIITTLLNTWSPMSLLDPTRVTYLSYGRPTTYGVDNEHANAVLEDTNDNSVIISLRNQNAVFSVSRSTGQLNWILGPHENWGTNWQPYLLKPIGTPFTWNYAQHAPEVTPRRTLLLYDDGNDRASPFDTLVADKDNYSRGVEYNINETNMEVSQVWDSSAATNEDRLFTPILGDADSLPKTGNILVTYGFVSYINGVSPSPYAPAASMVRIKEYTHDAIPQVVFDLSFFDYDNTNSSYAGYVCYRSDRIPDLYAHPATTVSDLTERYQNGVPLIEFSADPVRTYSIQASDDLVNWTVIGAASPDDTNGDFSYQDLDSAEYSARYYRVITQ